MFLSPWLLGGVALASVPVVIHLLNRRRFTRLDWAPMHYLKLTIRSNRRRLQLEQWLLLLIRALAVAALFFAVARPVASGTGLIGWFAGSERVSRVIVLDDSMSMGLRDNGSTAFSRAKNAAASLLPRIGRQDTLTFMTTAHADQPLLSDTPLEDADALAAEVQALKPTSAAANWPAILERVAARLDNATFPTREITLITDLQATNWEDRLDGIAADLAAKRTRIRIIDVGMKPTPNHSLSAFGIDQPLALVDAPLAMLSTVHASAGEPMDAGQATLVVDGQERLTPLPEVPAGGEVEVQMPIELATPGPHTVELRLPADALPADDRRWSVLDVRESLQVVLVDGEPDAQPFASETDFLALAFSIGHTPWRIQRMTDLEWLQAPMAAPDVLVLANVAALPAERAADVRNLVEAGMGLIIFAGDRMDPQAWNEAASDTAGRLLPTRLIPPDAIKAEGLTVATVTDSPLAPLTQLATNVLAAPRPRQAMPLTELENDPDVRVLAHWNDLARTPAALGYRIGRGQVLLINATADRAWGNWPTEPSFVLMVRSAALALAPRQARKSLLAGEPLTLHMDPAAAPTTVNLLTPGAAGPVSVPVAGLDETGSVGIRLTNTAAAGVYEVTWKQPAGGAQSRRFAFNPPASESILEQIDPQRLADRLAPVDVSIISLGKAGLGPEQHGSELWRSLALALVTLLAAESLLAAWVGRER